MKLRWRSRACVVALLAIGGLAVAFIGAPRLHKWYEPPVLALPVDDEVMEVRASLQTSEFFEAVPEFVVPPEHIPVVLGQLRSTKYAPRPPIFPRDEFGEIVIRTRTDRDVRLRLFWAGQNPVVITADGVDYFWGHEITDGGDGGIRLGKLIRTAHKATQR